MKVCELIEQLINADLDSVVVFLDSYASAYESDEVREAFVDAQLWTHETGLRHGECYEIRYPYAPEPAEGRSHNITAQFLEHVVVLSDGPTNLRYLTRYQPSKRQQKLIKRALASHRWAQAIGRYVPSRLVRKWTSESPTSTNEGDFAQRKKRRFLGRFKVKRSWPDDGAALSQKYSKAKDRNSIVVVSLARRFRFPESRTEPTMKKESAMTMPHERTRALREARGQLLQLSRRPPELDTCGFSRAISPRPQAIRTME